MSSFIILRRKTKDDDLKCQELVKDYIMSFAWSVFVSCIFKEITIEVIIISWAVLFIFFGIPIVYCTLTIPLCLFMILVAVYALCFMKASECGSIYSNKESWVAEAFEPLLDFKSPQERDYQIYFEHSPFDAVYESKFRKTIIGLISLDTHNALYNSGWIQQLAINKNYNNESIIETLVTQVLKICCQYNYNNVEAVTNIWQERERDTFYKMGFLTRQIYHKPISGTNLRVQKCQLGISLLDWRNNQTKQAGDDW